VCGGGGGGGVSVVVVMMVVMVVVMVVVGYTRSPRPDRESPPWLVHAELVLNADWTTSDAGTVDLVPHGDSWVKENGVQHLRQCFTCPFLLFLAVLLSAIPQQRSRKFCPNAKVTLCHTLRWRRTVMRVPLCPAS
jgi:hypothetical protein